MGDFFAELKRRHIYRVGAAYVVVAWALIQVIDVLSQIFELPGSIARPAVILLAIGFPVALIAAWMIESKPHIAVASAVRSKPTIVDWTLCSALAVVVLLIGYQLIAPPMEAQRSTSVRPTAPVSLAVLPFTNLSSDPEQEFFSDGMTEEITSALAKVPDLRVVARTSAYEFKGQNRSVQEIGQQLHATHLIEGSVRKAGDRLRITVQLISAADGTHVWSQDYDRQLTDIFAIQEDIARTITTSLRTPLGLKAGENLVNNRNIDPETYQQYLRARASYRIPDRRTALALAEEVVARDPGFAPAWALLARIHTGAADPTLGGDPLIAPALAKAEMAARRAVELDSKGSDGYVSLGVLSIRRGKPLAADEFYSKALALDPNHPDALNLYGRLLAGVGQPKRALAMSQDSLGLEPLVPAFKVNTADQLWLTGQDDAAIAILKSLPSDNRDGGVALAGVYAAQARYREAAEMLRTIPIEFFPDGTAAEAIRLLNSAPMRTALVPRLTNLGRLSFACIYVDAPECVFQSLENAIDGGYSQSRYQAALWHASAAPLRKTERFKAFARKAGFVDYWRAKGWPEFCRPVGADDFMCE